MRGGDQDRAGARALQGLDYQALLVDGDRQRGQSGVQDEPALAAVSRLLDGQFMDAEALEGVGEQGQALGEPRGDHHLPGLGVHRAHPAQIAGEFVAQFGDAG